MIVLLVNGVSQSERQHDNGKLRLTDDASQNDGIERESKRRDDHDGEERADPVVEAEMGNQAERHEAAQHHDVALGEVDHLGRLVDQDETERDQPVDAAGGGSIDDKLQQARSAFHDQRPSLLGGADFVAPRHFATRE